MRWRTRTGAPWRGVPARFGEWKTAYGLFWRLATQWHLEAHSTFKTRPRAPARVRRSVWSGPPPAPYRRLVHPAASPRRPGTAHWSIPVPGQ
ncbi:hypothetical protein ACFY3G_44585 [Streptomyces phaeochromogenes]|uniref:hypothetical protein n=1 Tax=Streptomyces phaeochromogenes TaxID=1923 RepID=UPI0036864034